MIVRAFAIRDDKAESFMAPFFMPAVGQALRAFHDLVNDGAGPVGLHPGDYKLFQVGEFDDASGLLAGKSVPVLLASGDEYRALENDAKVAGIRKGRVS